MNAAPDNQQTIMIRPPRLIQSLVSGFNAVASHIYLILLPVALDLLLWFGPHFRVKTLMEPGLNSMLTLMRQTSSLDMKPVLDNMESIWKLFLEQYNLISAVSTFPVGVPTLMAGQLPVKTPVGAPMMLEVQSLGQMVLFWLLLSLVGMLLGCAYFAWVARATVSHARQSDPESICPEDGRLPAFRLGTLGWEAMQVLALILLVLAVLTLIMIPTLVVSVLLALISPFLAQLVLLLVSFGSVWFLVPLVFSPHGIFMCGSNVLNAMLTSTRVVRFILPGTGLFLLCAIVINQGLGLLWTTPPASSWMALVGIFGHAFIITGLLSASFVYYRGGLSYIQALRKLSAVSA